MPTTGALQLAGPPHQAPRTHTHTYIYDDNDVCDVYTTPQHTHTPHWPPPATSRHQPATAEKKREEEEVDPLYLNITHIMCDTQARNRIRRHVDGASSSSLSISRGRQKGAASIAAEANVIYTYKGKRISSSSSSSHIYTCVCVQEIGARGARRLHADHLCV
jgi:hypothetical protein